MQGSGDEGFWAQFPKLLLLSVVSIFVPAGYNNDYRSHHPRIKGGLFILLNHTFDMLWIGLALGFTIINNVPNSIKGVSLPQPSLKVQVKRLFFLLLFNLFFFIRTPAHY